jgi:hypothetical protein
MRYGPWVYEVKPTETWSCIACVKRNPFLQPGVTKMALSAVMYAKGEPRCPV